MKKFYFAMESKLALHLGWTKPALHTAIQESTHLGRKVNDEGVTVYESIADVTDEETMMSRITEFQEWASLEFNFRLEPFYDETRNRLPDDLGPQQESGSMESEN